MHYEKPEFFEIKMDAEIGSYQNDFDEGRDPRFAEPARSESVNERGETEG